MASRAALGMASQGNSLPNEVSKEDLTASYADLPTSALLELVDRKHEYTESAVSVALAELGRRQVTEAEILAYKNEEVAKVEMLIERNIIADLNLWQKNFFFFLFFLAFPFKLNFLEDHYLLKLKQARYYSGLGFVTFLAVGFIASASGLSDLVGIALWMVFFLFTLAFDEFFNRRRMMLQLQARFPKGVD